MAGQMRIECLTMYPPALFLRFAIGYEFNADDLTTSLTGLTEEALQRFPLVVMDLRTTRVLSIAQAAFMLAMAECAERVTGKPLGVILEDMTSSASLVRTVLRRFAPFPEYLNIAAAQTSVAPPSGS